MKFASSNHQMPQLDKVHFFSQYFWLCVFYFGFYFLIAKYFLPRMARILQFRKSKCATAPQEGGSDELDLVKDSANTALENVFSTSHKFWSQNTQRMEGWYGDKVQSLNNNYLKECNHLYIKKVGSYSLSQNAALALLDSKAPSASYTWFLTRKLKDTGSNKMSLIQSYSSAATLSQPFTKKTSKKTGQGKSTTSVDKVNSTAANKKIRKPKK